MAVCSMTGYTVTNGTCDLGSISIELRSVNARFLDLTLRLPEDLRFMETAVRETIQGALARGKVEARFSVLSDGESAPVLLNRAALERVLALQDAVLETAPEARRLSVSDLMKMPGVLETHTPDQEKVVAQVVSLLKTALEQFIGTRNREGEALAAVLRNNCVQIETVVAQVQKRLPDILAYINGKLQERLEGALSSQLAENATLSREEINERIRQEVTLYAVRMDVEEEMNRLLTHVAEMRRTLDKGGPIGRRLDFLVQEMNREANTLGSKAAAIEMTNAALELKVVIEQMREQIQNIE